MHVFLLHTQSRGGGVGHFASFRKDLLDPSIFIRGEKAAPGDSPGLATESLKPSLTSLLALYSADDSLLHGSTSRILIGKHPIHSTSGFFDRVAISFL